MSCFHPFWLENAGWRGAELKAGLGATAVFREGEAGGKLPVGEREGKEEEEELEGKEEVEELEGKEFGCSFAISSSIETAST